MQSSPQSAELRLVRDVLRSAGPRGASHEDFVEAGLARDYIGTLRRLAASGAEIQTDFTTGQPRFVWLRDAR